MSSFEWDDLMPHRVTAISQNGFDMYGKPLYDETTTRTYQCLVDDSTTVLRTVDGTTVNIALVAYTNAIPIGKSAPVDIENSAKVEILDPTTYGRERPVHSIGRHYWIDGSLHNLEVRFQ